MSDVNSSTENGTRPSRPLDTSVRVDIYLTAHEVEVLAFLREQCQDVWPAVSTTLFDIMNRFEDSVLRGIYREFNDEKK